MDDESETRKYECQVNLICEAMLYCFIVRPVRAKYNSGNFLFNSFENLKMSNITTTSLMNSSQLTQQQ
jgi:hypothetical protein